MAFREANLEHLAKFNSSGSMYLLDAYNKQLDDDISGRASMPSHKTFAPSALRCKRRSWFRLRGTQPDKPRSTDRILEFTADVGTACHSMVQERLIRALKSSDQFEWIDVVGYLRSEGFFDRHDIRTLRNGYETQVEFKNPPVRFAVDGLLRYDDEYCLFEIKTSEYSAWNDLTDPKEEHIDQFKAYCTLLELNRGFFFYVDRQYGGIKCFELHVSLQDQEEIRTMFKEVQQYAEFGIAPDPLPTGDKWCTPNFCPYYEKCKHFGR